MANPLFAFGHTETVINFSHLYSSALICTMYVILQILNNDYKMLSYVDKDVGVDAALGVDMDEDVGVDVAGGMNYTLHYNHFFPSQEYAFDRVFQLKIVMVSHGHDHR